MVFAKGTQAMLDLRYNEMWNEWDGTNELQPRDPSRQAHGQLVLSWKRLNVSVKLTTRKCFGPSKVAYKQILHNVSGNVQCGNLLGIMGPSGSGKTTLMSTISHRTNGNFDGELLLNGKPVSEDVMIKISGFVPQHDISFDQLTALEHLSLMANLKTDRRTARTVVRARVDRIVSALGMSSFSNTRISFLSGGERKKVALAVQLLNDPAILFCDEITTGLDSYSAAHIVNTLKSVARNGKIVICTIHQPASGVFGNFDEVILLSNGQLAYQGPVSMVNQLFKKFNYECPNMYNEADFVVSLLNSDNDTVKRDVDKMCKMSSNNKQIELNYDSFNNQKQLDYTKLILQTQKPKWKTQFSLILNRSIKCFLRSYKSKLFELSTVLFLGVIISSPFANLQFDTKAVQNWEGFWFILVMNFVFQFSYSGTTIYQAKFSVVHREVHNKAYPLSAYYTSELMIMIVWILMKISLYYFSASWIVGTDCGCMQLLVFFLVAFASFSSGSLLSAYFSCVEDIMIFTTIYNFASASLCGPYLSLNPLIIMPAAYVKSDEIYINERFTYRPFRIPERSLPKVMYSLRYFSLCFLGCESVSTLFWDKIKSIPCVDANSNCLSNGKAVLDKYGFVSEEFNSNLMILFIFSIFANVLSYVGVLNRMKKQPAY